MYIIRDWNSAESLAGFTPSSENKRYWSLSWHVYQFKANKFISCCCEKVGKIMFNICTHSFLAGRVRSVICLLQTWRTPYRCFVFDVEVTKRLSTSVLQGAPPTPRQHHSVAFIWQQKYKENIWKKNRQFWALWYTFRNQSSPCCASWDWENQRTDCAEIPKGFQSNLLSLPSSERRNWCLTITWENCQKKLGMLQYLCRFA